MLGEWRGGRERVSKEKDGREYAKERKSEMSKVRERQGIGS